MKIASKACHHVMLPHALWCFRIISFCAIFFRMLLFFSLFFSLLCHVSSSSTTFWIIFILYSNVKMNDDDDDDGSNSNGKVLYRGKMIRKEKKRKEWQQMGDGGEYRERRTNWVERERETRKFENTTAFQMQSQENHGNKSVTLNGKSNISYTRTARRHGMAKYNKTDKRRIIDFEWD